MGNMILAFPDKTANASLSGGSWQQSFPLSNIAVSLLALKARTTDALAASSTFDVNLGLATKLRVLALIGHNLSIAATIRVRLSTVADFATNVYDSGTIAAYPNYYDTAALEWGQPVLTNNKPSTAHAIAMRYPLFFCASALVTAQYARVEITDTANPDGYIEISRCFIAPGLQPPRNFLAAAQWSFETDTRKEKSLNGTPYFGRVEALKSCTFTVPDATIESGMGQYLEMQRFLNLDQELFLVADPAAVCMSLRQRSFLGRLRQLSPLEQTSVLYADMGFVVEESV